MDKINTVLVAFSATSIHKELAMRALDVAEQNNAKLIILSVRDKNIAEKVAKITKNHGFLGEKVVNKLKEDIVRDRDEVISRRLAIIEKYSKERGVIFEIVRVKGDFVEKVIDVARKYNVDMIIIEDIISKMDRLNEIS